MPPIIQPVSILHSRVILRGQHQVTQYLIQWEGLDAAVVTWEDHDKLQQAFSEFNLEDKVHFNGGGIVTSTAETGNNKIHNRGAEESITDAIQPEHLTDHGGRKSRIIKITNYRLKDFDRSKV